MFLPGVTGHWMNCVTALSYLCSQGKFLLSRKLPQQWAECSGPWEMAHGLEVTPVPGENQSLCASEALAPMLGPLSLRRKKHTSVSSSTSWEVAAFAGIFCLFSLLSLANIFPTPGMTSNIFDRAEIFQK